MILDPDIIVERRRLKRRLGFWRLVAVLGIVGAIAIATRNDAGSLAVGSHVARVSISGLIQDDRKQAEMLARLANDTNAKAVLVHIDSLGGTTAGGEMLYTGLRRIAEKKPVVAVFGTTATSAGYMAGIAADHIVARGNTITGSVGVLIQWPEVSEALNKLGIKVEEIKSGPAKAEPSPFHPITPEGRQVAQDMIAESQGWFVGLVEQRRKPAPATVEELRSGRIYSGRLALARGLIDEIGDEHEAKGWLASARQIDPDSRVIDWKPKDRGGWAMLTGADDASSSLGRAARTVISGAEQLFGRVGQLDGLVSVWHP